VSDAAPAPMNSRNVLHQYGAGWLGAVAQRRSRRAYDAIPADAMRIETLQALISQWRPYPDARVELVERPTVDVFTGAVGHYGKISGAPHILAFIGKKNATFTNQHVGYTGEAIVLEATRLGLQTCWVGGYFNPSKTERLVALAPDERVVAVSPLGHALRKDTSSQRAIAHLAGSNFRKRVGDIALRSKSGAWPAWALAAAETVRFAPSAANRQPWRLRFEDGALIIGKDSSRESSKVAKRLDIGVAMLHADLAFEAHGIDGAWTDLTGTDVARFDPVSPAR